jgi:hypothetical protein
VSTEKPVAAPSRTSATVNRIIVSLLVVVLAGLANYLAFRHYKRFDWTRQSIYSLSPRTKVVLHGLTRNLDIYLFMSRGEPARADLDELLERYRAETTHLTIHSVDPETQPREFQALAQRFGVGGLQNVESGELSSDVDIVVAAGAKHWKITREDLVELDLSSVGDDGDASNVSTKVKSEQALTGAILQVTSGRDTKVCVTAGHGEWAIEGQGDRSLSALQHELQRSNIILEEFPTLGQAVIPRACDAVFVVGPQTPFREAEAGALAAYVRAGGNLLVTLDPVVERDVFTATGLETMLHGFGVVVDPDVVIERDSSLLNAGPGDIFFVTTYGEHVTTSVLKRLRPTTALRIARSVRPIDIGSRAVPLLLTSGEAYGETSISELGGETAPAKNGADLAGPLSLAVAVDTRARRAEPEGDTPPAPQQARMGGRMIIVGTSSWLEPAFIDRPEVANYDLSSAWTGWLTQREALIAIAPKRVQARAVVMAEGDLSSLAFRVLFLMPMSVLLLGIAVWWTRRQ